MSRILVAEDEQRISSFIDKGLRAHGFTVTLVADGPHQVAMSGSQDLLLLDLGLPLLDGFVVLQRLRRDGCRLPVIILTARSGVDVYIRYLRRKLDPRRIETVRGIGYRLGDGSPAADG